MIGAWTWCSHSLYRWCFWSFPCWPCGGMRITYFFLCKTQMKNYTQKMCNCTVLVVSLRVDDLLFLASQLYCSLSWVFEQKFTYQSHGDCAQFRDPLSITEKVTCKHLLFDRYWGLLGPWEIFYWLEFTLIKLLRKTLGFKLWDYHISTFLLFLLLILLVLLF